MPELLSIPECLKAKSVLFDVSFTANRHPCLLAVQRLIVSSDYAARHIELIKTLLAKDDLQSPLERADYLQELETIPLDEPVNRFGDALRTFRHQHFFRIYLRELAGLSDTQETLKSWSECADALIIRALDYCHYQQQKRYGQPESTDGQRSQLLVLGMGKLGGKELNFSSDIDLIFAFSSNGQTSGPESISHQEFFSKVVQQFVSLMQNVTVQGFVFRVDLRLRPNGESGPLVFSLAAMETYYQEQGRDWERYAMLKARIINPVDEALQTSVEQLITPFVYRRYVDFSVIESLRSMKAMIEREVRMDPYLNDIKRGQGGIREIEFIIQNIQLIRGGRIPQIRERNAMKALTLLKQQGLMDRTEALKQAYLFLRKLENALQVLNDQQTHALPGDALKKAQVAFAMGYESWEPLEQRLHQYQRIVSMAFQSVLKKVEAYEDDKRLLMNQLMNLWQGHVEQRMAVNLLTSLGYSKAEHCYQMIYSFRHSPRCRRLSQAARMRLDRFMVMLLVELAEVKKDTDKVLLQVMHLLENIVGRSAYLALLTENLSALRELLYWFAHSSFISSLLVNQPFLLEVLLDKEAVWRPQRIGALRQMLTEQLFHCEKEQQEDVLREFKLTQWLLAARAELYHHCSAVRISRFLSDVAEVILEALFEMACQQLKEKHPEIESIKSHFAIVAYGKFGSREMNYTSDLDLVFLHDVDASQEHLVNRLTQKILHMLTARSQSGILYAVDTRLRPSGSAGLLVSPVDAFKEYQKNNAWTWEHQALVKARVILGSQRIKRAFSQLKQDVFLRDRALEILRKEVLDMRKKIDKYQSDNPIKYAPGGLLDLEFLIQFLILSSKIKAISRYTHPLTQLEKLYQMKVVKKRQYEQLQKAYHQFHHVLHQQLLHQETETEDQLRSQITNLIKHLYQQ